jgi:hypothetical protein
MSHDIVHFTAGGDRERGSRSASSRWTRAATTGCTGFRVVEAGPFELKGIANPLTLYEAIRGDG